MTSGVVKFAKVAYFSNKCNAFIFKNHENITPFVLKYDVLCICIKY